MAQYEFFILYLIRLTPHRHITNQRLDISDCSPYPNHKQAMQTPAYRQSAITVCSRHSENHMCLGGFSHSTAVVLGNLFQWQSIPSTRKSDWCLSFPHIHMMVCGRNILSRPSHSPSFLWQSLFWMLLRRIPLTQSLSITLSYNLYQEPLICSKYYPNSFM